MNRSLPLALFALGAVSACQATPPNPMTFNFNRPTGAAQVCVRVEVHSDGTFLTDTTGQIISTPEPHPLLDCVHYDTNMPVATNGRFFAFRMFAAVSQSDRGELAMVNTHPTIGPSLIDNDPLIPGFTFIPVGLFPGAVVVHPDGKAIYVANTGENTISVIDTRTILRTQTAGSGSLGGVIRFDQQLHGHPGDLAIGRIAGHTLLFVTLPDHAELATIELADDGTPGTPAIISLGARISGGLDGGIGGDGGAGGDAGAAGDYRPERIAISTIDQNGSGTLGDIDRVYVSDSRSPVVHTIQVMADGTALEVEPLTTLSPTRALTVTPTILTTDPPRHFVYAAGASDGTLTVLDTITRVPVVVNASQADPACHEGTPTFDANACHRIDAKISLYNIPIKSTVVSLATVTRDAMDTATCTTRVAAPPGALSPGGSSDACTMTSGYSDEGTAALNTIRGVAVVVGLRDGTLRIIDVEDWQAYCSPDRRAQASQTNPAPQRHLPRVATAYVDPATLNTYLTPPAYSVNGSLTQPSDSDPHLMNLTLPMSGGAIDPLRVRDDSWLIQYQGPIPGLTLRVGALQAFDAEDVNLHADVPGAQFCTKGGLEGDIVTLVDPSPCVQDPVDNDAGPRVLPDPALCNGDGGADAGMSICSQVFGTATAPCNRRLDVVGLTENSITLRPFVEDSTCSPIPITDAHQLSQLIRQCYPQAVLLALRVNVTHDASGNAVRGTTWAVSATGAGYIHSVHADATQHCVETLPNPGRLIEDQPFDGPGFSATITHGMQPSPRDAAYSFSISGGLSPLLVSGGLVPSSMFYSCATRRLYFVDQSRASLTEYPVAPMSTPRTFN